MSLGSKTGLNSKLSVLRRRGPLGTDSIINMAVTSLFVAELGALFFIKEQRS